MLSGIVGRNSAAYCAERTNERGGIRCAIPPYELMAYPGPQLLRLTKYRLYPVTVKETDHKIMREFCDDPKGFVEATIEE